LSIIIFRTKKILSRK